MPEKTTADGHVYSINGKRLTWPADVDHDAGEEPFDVILPMRIKLGTIIDLDVSTELDASGMAQFIAGIAPGQMDRIREMDLNDFQAMFTTWQQEYNTLSGASLGESSSSSS